MVDSPPGRISASQVESCSGVRTGMKVKVVLEGNGRGGVEVARRRS